MPLGVFFAHSFRVGPDWISIFMIRTCGCVAASNRGVSITLRSIKCSCCLRQMGSIAFLWYEFDVFDLLNSIHPKKC